MERFALAPPNDDETHEQYPLALPYVALAFAATAIALVANDWIIERRVVALLRRKPRLRSDAIANGLGFSSSYGSAAIARALARLNRRNVVSKETGWIYHAIAEAWVDVDVWTITQRGTAGASG